MQETDGTEVKGGDTGLEQQRPEGSLSHEAQTVTMKVEARDRRMTQSQRGHDFCLVSNFLKSGLLTVCHGSSDDSVLD